LDRKRGDGDDSQISSRATCRKETTTEGRAAGVIEGCGIDERSDLQLIISGWIALFLRIMRKNAGSGGAQSMKVATEKKKRIR